MKTRLRTITTILLSISTHTPTVATTTIYHKTQKHKDKSENIGTRTALRQPTQPATSSRCLITVFYVKRQVRPLNIKTAIRQRQAIARVCGRFRRAAPAVLRCGHSVSRGPPVEALPREKVRQTSRITRHPATRHNLTLTVARRCAGQVRRTGAQSKCADGAQSKCGKPLRALVVGHL